MIRTAPVIRDPEVVRDGAGFEVRRVFRSGPARRETDPFLLLDDVDAAFAAGEAMSSPPHSWSGIEALTWMLRGTTRHTWPVDGVRVIGPGAAEWVTAGAGCVHRETFDAGAARSLRLWVALPRAERRAPRSVQAVAAADIATDSVLGRQGDDPAGVVQVQLVCGRLFGARARVSTRSRVTIARLQIPPNTAFVHSVARVEPDAPGVTVLLYTLAGQVFVGGPDAAAETLLAEHRVAVLAAPAVPTPGLDGDEVRLRSGAAAADLLYLAGAPLNDPIEPRGPFALRSEEEAVQAAEEFRTGRFGTLAP